MYDSCTFVGGGRIHFHAKQVLNRREIAHHRLFHMESGQGVFIFSEMRVSITQGDIYLFAPGPREAVYPGGRPVAYEYVEFDLPTPLPHGPCLECRIGEPFRHALIHLLKSVIQEPGALRRQMLAMAVGLALHDTSGQTVADPRLRQVLRHIDEHADQTTDIPRLAELAGLSEPQLRRLFHAQLGTSPKQYLMRARMDYARRLLQAEGLRVKEVADLMGFPSAFQFSAQYSKIHGLSPSRDTRGPSA